MKIKGNTDGLGAFLQRAVEHINAAMAKCLADIVKESVETSRGSDFVNRTGNLRSSIGGAVYQQGREFMMTAFETILQGTMGHEAGEHMTRELAQGYTDAVVAVVVAAMPYADHVEAQGTDVMETARVNATRVVEVRLGEALEKAFKEINAWKI